MIDWCARHPHIAASLSVIALGLFLWSNVIFAMWPAIILVCCLLVTVVYLAFFFWFDSI